MAEDTIRWGPVTTILKAVALTVPWGVIEAAARNHADIGYTIGLFVGIMCMYAVPPRGNTLWRWLLGGLVIALLHPALRAVIPRSW